MGDAVNSYQVPDIDYLSDQVKSYKGQIKHLREEIQYKREEIAVKEKLGETLSGKYGCERSDIESFIETKMNRLNDEWNRDEAIRHVWKGTMEKFTGLLNDPNTAKYDKKYYESIYKSSCNGN